MTIVRVALHMVFNTSVEKSVEKPGRDYVKVKTMKGF
jgi:hypothetical protein